MQLATGTLQNGIYTITGAEITTCECVIYSASTPDTSEVLIAEYYPAQIAGRNAEQTIIISSSHLDYFENNLNAFQKNAELIAAADTEGIFGITDVFSEMGTSYIVANKKGGIADFYIFFSYSNAKKAKKFPISEVFRSYFTALYKSHNIGHKIFIKSISRLFIKLLALLPFGKGTEKSKLYPDVPDAFLQFLFDAARNKIVPGEPLEKGLAVGSRRSSEEAVEPKPVIESLYSEPTKDDRLNFAKMHASVTVLSPDINKESAPDLKWEQVKLMSIFLAGVALMIIIVGIIAYFILLPILI